MGVEKNNEERRSKVWRITVVTTTLIIVAIVVYFLMKIFIGNPLIATWLYKKDTVSIVFEEDGNGYAQYFTEGGEKEHFVVPFEYKLDEENKHIEFSMLREKMNSINEKDYTEEEINEIKKQLSMTPSSFLYEIVGNELLLKDREIGDEYRFIKE